MTFSSEQIEALKAPLNRAFVKERTQAGRALSYIEGWKAIDEANRIFGYDGWDRQLYTLKEVGEARQVDGKWRVSYMATVRVTVRAAGTATMKDKGYPELNVTEIVRDGTGYGSGIDKDLGQAHESAIKEAETDAMKRALMTFGNPFGLALYDKEQKNVVDEPKARAAQYTNIEDEITDCETLVALDAVMQRRKVEIEHLSEEDKADLRKVYAFKKKALSTFGEAA